MYSFGQRPDTQILDEPLYAHYLIQTGIEHPGREEVIEAQENDGRKVVKEVFLAEYSQPNVFFKNMAKHLTRLDTSFLTQLKNILLIREPSQMLPSFIKNVENPTLQETALKDQWDLHLHLSSVGTPPGVIDSRDLLSDPEGMLKVVCDFLHIEYMDCMLSWPAGPRKEDGVWANYWYHNVHKSTGFQPYSHKQDPIEPRYQSLLEECNLYYHKLYEKRLTWEKS